MELVHSNHEEDNAESKFDNDVPTFKIDLAGNPNSCIIKKQFHALLDSASEESLIHTKVYNSLKGKTKTREMKCIS